MHASLSSSPSPSRLWRPAAQRNIRNSWSKIVGSIFTWKAASANALAAATSVVNSHLNCRYMHSMDLGVLKGMEEIQDKANAKLIRKQERDLCTLISGYKDLVDSAVQMFIASKSMRTYLKGSVNSPILEFCNYPNIDNDAGDGGGIAVFTSLPLKTFESLGEEIVNMFISELKMKRLLVLEFQSTVYKKEQESCNSWDWSDEIYPGELEGLDNLKSNLNMDLMEMKIDSNLPGQGGDEKTRETLQVYLTTWLAEIHINTPRIEEVKVLVEDEMQARLI